MVVVARCHQLDNIHAKGNFVCLVMNMYNMTTMRRKMLQLFSFDFALLRSTCLVCLVLHKAHFFCFSFLFRQNYSGTCWTRKTRDINSAFLNLQIYEVSSSSSVGITKSIF